MAAKLLVEAVFIWGFVGSQMIHFQHGCLMWWLADNPHVPNYCWEKPSVP